MSIISIKKFNDNELKQLVNQLGQPDFRAKQIREWLNRGITDFNEMTNLPKALIDKLNEGYTAQGLSIELEQVSKDGTKKFLLKCPDGEFVEAVFMTYEYGNSICVSTQVGCNMGCRFCASTIGGKHRDLMAWEILDEFLVVQQAAGPINHVVLMGMGEPFDNYDNVAEFLRIIHDPKGINLSYRNITVSTCGVIPGIKKFTEEFPQVNLAISLHEANQKARESLMPIAKVYPLSELMPVLKEHAQKTGRRITYEYTLIAGKNDGEDNAKEIAQLLKGQLCHVNLIPLNPVTESGMTGSSREAAREFAQRIEKLGINATVRRELGSDIDAACGQLRKQKL